MTVFSINHQVNISPVWLHQFSIKMYFGAIGKMRNLELLYNYCLTLIIYQLCLFNKSWLLKNRQFKLLVMIVLLDDCPF